MTRFHPNIDRAIMELDTLDCREPPDERVDHFLGMMGWLALRVQNAMDEGGCRAASDTLLLDMVERVLREARAKVRRTAA